MIFYKVINMQPKHNAAFGNRVILTTTDQVS